MELLFFKYDHSTATPTPTIEQIAALHKPMDLVHAAPDGWTWGKQELSNPWFRIVSIPDSLATMAQAEQFLSPLLPLLDSSGNPTTLWQRRAYYLNLTDSIIPSSFNTFWEDDTRAMPIYIGQPSFTATALQLGVARPHINNPAYVGISYTPKAITS
jgi:hypothetical protein